MGDGKANPRGALFVAVLNALSASPLKWGAKKDAVFVGGEVLNALSASPLKWDGNLFATLRTS